MQTSCFLEVPLCSKVWVLVDSNGPLPICSFQFRSYCIYINNKWCRLFKGFGDRLLSELKKMSPKDVKIRVSIC